jgi:hypothetical protein
VSLGAGLKGARQYNSRGLSCAGLAGLAAVREFNISITVDTAVHGAA